MIGMFQVNLDDYRVGANKRATSQFPIAILETLFEAFTRINEAWIRATPSSPLLYKSGIKYRRDPSKLIHGEKLEELWLDAPSILRRGSDDCEGLACYLAAELRCRSPNSLGMKKYPHACVKLKRTRHAGLLHAIVFDPVTRQIFDPSRALGMGKKEI